MKPSRLALIALLAIVALFVIIGSFGLTAPFFWGHGGYHGAVYMLRARMSWRHHTPDPLSWTGFDPPEPGALYYHHPVMGHHFLTALTPIFGEVEWLPRACGVTFGVVAVLAIYAIGARFFSRRFGLLAAATWVLLPNTISFSNLYDMMFLEMAAVLWTLYAWLMLWEKPSWRMAWLALLANLGGGLVMWEVFFVSPMLALAALLLALGRERREAKLGRIHIAWVFTFAAGIGCVIAAVIHFVLAWKAGALADMAASYNLRKGGMSVRYIIDRHVEWMRILYGWPPVVIGGLWIAQFVTRLVRRKVEKRDAVPLTFLLTNILYIILFAEGSAVHLYRVSFFSLFFAFAAADLVERGTRYLIAKDRPPRTALAIALAPFVIYHAVEAPHAYRNLLESRATAETHITSGYNPEQTKLLFFREVEKRTQKEDRVFIHYGQWGARKELWFYLDRSFTNVSNLSAIPANPGRAVAIFDESKLSREERQRFLQWAAHHPVTFYDHFTMVDFRERRTGIESFTFRPQPMSAGYRWFVSHKFPPQEIVKQLYLPGVCQLVDQGIAPPADVPMPATPPRDDAMRLCRQHLTALRDPAAAAKMVKELVDPKVEERARPLGEFADVYFHWTAPDRLRVVVVAKAKGPADGKLWLQHRATTDGAPPVRVTLGLPAPGTMQPGFAYAEEVRGVTAAMQPWLELGRPAVFVGPLQPGSPAPKKGGEPVYEVTARTEAQP